MAIAVNKEYELVLMLDPDVPDERRDQIADETRKRIEAGGTIKHDASWGMRKLAYEIRQRTEADYRLFRFEGQNEVLDELNHNLRIADGVLRFRIFKVDPGSPTIVPPPAMGTSGAPTRAPRRDEAPTEAAAAPTEAASEAPAETETAAPAETETAPEEAAPAPAAETPEAGEPAPEAPAEQAEAQPAPESGEEPAS